jgi:hypothetical protein
MKRVKTVCLLQTHSQDREINYKQRTPTDGAKCYKKAVYKDLGTKKMKLDSAWEQRHGLYISLCTPDLGT